MWRVEYWEVKNNVSILHISMSQSIYYAAFFKISSSTYPTKVGSFSLKFLSISSEVSHIFASFPRTTTHSGVKLFLSILAYSFLRSAFSFLSKLFQSGKFFFGCRQNKSHARSAESESVCRSGAGSDVARNHEIPGPFLGCSAKPT